MKLANNNDIHKISEEFENRSDQTNVIELCPLDGQDCLLTLYRPSFQSNQLQAFSE